MLLTVSSMIIKNQQVFNNVSLNRNRHKKGYVFGCLGGSVG